VVWRDPQRGEKWYEVKCGRLDQKYVNKIVRFCRQYPQHKLVLVWVGSKPKANPRRKAKNLTRWERLEKLQRYVDHVWWLK